MISFTVPGDPVPQGSHVAAISRTTGKPFVKPAHEKKLRPWRRAITTVARAAMHGRPPIAGPVAVRCRFVLTQPKTNEDRWPTNHRTGDADKMLRAVLDGCTGVVFVDDSQVVQAITEKRWGDPARVEVELVEVGPGVRG